MGDSKNKYRRYSDQKEPFPKQGPSQKYYSTFQRSFQNDRRKKNEATAPITDHRGSLGSENIAYQWSRFTVAHCREKRKAEAEKEKILQFAWAAATIFYINRQVYNKSIITNALNPLLRHIECAYYL